MSVLDVSERDRWLQVDDAPCFLLDMARRYEYDQKYVRHRVFHGSAGGMYALDCT